MNIKDEERTQSIINNKKDTVALSIYLLEENVSIIKCEKNVYIYNGKCYDLAGPEDIEKMFHKFIMKYGITSAWAKRRDVVESVLAYQNVPSVSKMNDYHNLINLNNGVFNLLTKELTPHSPEYYFDSFINIDYLPEEKNCPHFIKYLKDTFDNNNSVIQNIIYMGGYLLDSESNANKMFMFNGPGGSGKSTLIDTFSLFFDNSQITALSLDDLSSGTFDKEGLITSRVNFSAEQKRGYIDAEEIKKIISGDMIKVSRKFKLAVTFRPKTKVIVACNGLPKFTDTSEGIFRRLVIINFNNQYRSGDELKFITHAKERKIFKKDTELFDKIKKEKNAIFNLFMEGLIDLRKRNYEFVITKDNFDIISDFKRDSDTVREFLEENYVIDMDAETPAQEVYEHYRIWYRSNVQDTVAMKFRINELSKRIREVFSVNSTKQRNLYIPAEESYRRLAVYPIKRIVVGEVEIAEEESEKEKELDNLFNS